jgi:hypothetical protein
MPGDADIDTDPIERPDSLEALDEKLDELERAAAVISHAHTVLSGEASVSAKRCAVEALRSISGLVHLVQNAQRDLDRLRERISNLEQDA